MANQANEIHAFQTGRRYRKEGQRIAWQIFTSETDEDGCIIYVISFADADRNIDGVVRIKVGHSDIPLRNSDILDAYDSGGYGYDDDRDRTSSLYRAALSDAPALAF